MEENGGYLDWTEARKHSFIVSVLRSGTRRWPPKYETLNAAKTTRKINKKTGRLAQHYRCALCEEEFPATGVQVDHKVPVVDPVKGFKNWDTFIKRLFCEATNLQVVCKPCHKAKTKAENKK